MSPADTPDDDDFARQLRRAVRELPDAPLALQQAAIDLFASSALAPTLRGVAEAALRVIAAVLTFDSWATPAAAAGTRSPRSATTRHLLFNAEGRDIDLRVSTTGGGGYAISGQILGPDDAGSIALIPPDGGAERRVEVDALGEFRAEGLDAGAWQVRLLLGGDTIVLPPVEVGEA